MTTNILLCSKLLHSLVKELQIALKNYSVLLDVLLGAQHRMSHDFRRFVHSWDRITLEVEASFGDQIRS